MLQTCVRNRAGEGALPSSQPRGWESTLEKGVLNKEVGGEGWDSLSSRALGCESCWEKVTAACDSGAGFSGMVSELRIMANAGHWAGTGALRGCLPSVLGLVVTQRGVAMAFFPHRL